MKINEKIRTLREMKNLTQEAVAEQISMSTNGYAKIERGESRPNIDRLQQIAEIFEVDVIQLLSSENENMVFIIGDNGGHVGDNSGYSKNYYGNSTDIILENEKLKLTVQHNDELLEQLRSENKVLKTLVENLKNQT